LENKKTIEFNGIKFVMSLFHNPRPEGEDVWKYAPGKPVNSPILQEIQYLKYFFVLIK
jgi:hypothetical protein